MMIDATGPPFPAGHSITALKAKNKIDNLRRTTRAQGEGRGLVAQR
tara:strand:+ start:2101 stop:2238 length:138 start_codon:yes stop_codon:yes gene_type:complete